MMTSAPASSTRRRVDAPAISSTAISDGSTSSPARSPGLPTVDVMRSRAVGACTFSQSSVPNQPNA